MPGSNSTCSAVAECHALDLFEFLERWQLAQVLQPETGSENSWSRKGRFPMTFWRPADAISLRPASVFRTLAPWTPRMAMTSGAVTGCL